MNSGCFSYSSSSLSWKAESSKKKFSSVIGLGGPAAVRARIARLRVVHVQVVMDAVLAGVGAFVDVAVLAAALEQVLHDARVLRAGGALEVVDLQPEQLPLLLELGGDHVAVFLRRLAHALGGALDVDTVLVGAGGQHGAVALHAF